MRADGSSAIDFFPGKDRLPAGAALMSHAEIITWVASRVRAREPAAIMRFGDSEAQVLEADVDVDSLGGARKLLERETGIPFSAESVLELQELLAWAYEKADVLGIRYRAQFADGRKRERLEKLARRYGDRVARGGSAATLAPCLFSYGALEVLPELLAGRPVSAISCRDLRPILEREWRAGAVTVYQVPSQSIVRDVDGAYEAAMHGERIWPDVHRRIHSQLTVGEPGEVFLVGAGVFGKDLCIRVRELGGIAIDMGSALDHLAGKLTRGPERRVLDLHAKGMSVAEIAARLEEVFDTPVEPNAVADVLEKHG